MKPLILAIALLGYATSAKAADAWTCTWPILDAKLRESSALVRFEIATPDLIETKAEPRDLMWLTPPGTHYRILQNNDYGLVATFSFSGLPEGAKDPYVGAISVVINKMTGQLLWAEATSTKNESRYLSNTRTGKCLHD
jgi:hypothetical protein